jgi:peptidoglycan/xylan/chitin deacetylase (PgdA/CDA1 family)
LSWETAALKALDAVNFLEVFRRLRGGGSHILTFHRFCHEAGPGLPRANLESCLIYLRERFRVIPLRQLAEALRRGEYLSDVIVLSIDDAHHDFYEIAFPLLRKYELPATLFVTAGFVEGALWLWPDHVEYIFRQAAKTEAAMNLGEESHRISLGNQAERLAQGREWVSRMKRLPQARRLETLRRLTEALEVGLPAKPPDEYRPVTWAELIQTRGAGIDIGSHTMTHPILSSLSGREAEWEIIASKEMIEQRLGCRVDLFCYPNGKPGDYSESTIAAVRKANYLCATTSINGVNRAGVDLFQLYRYGVPDNNFLRFKQIVSGFEDLKRNVRSMFSPADAG